MSWTDERVEILKKMWGEGKSASQIAKELGGITRNAVIGKVHRLGLSNRAAPKKAAPAREKAKPEAKAAAPKKPEPPRPLHVANATSIPPRRPIITAGQPLPPQPSANEISETALANAAAVVKSSKRLSLMELTEKTCKWPVGDPATDDFWFCGHPTEPGKPYCEAHNAVAFQPMSSRRDRRR
ncbi:MAG: GcrA family cell cycle regulator [Pseudomonadota bacterium]